MILTHGSNSISRGDENYILDDFIALYNGVTDSGYAINDGSFGQLLWDANGPIQAPNGQGMPYYARANFSGQNGGVMAIYDGLKSVFASNSPFTMELFFYKTSDPDNEYVFYAYNNDRSASVAGIKVINSYSGGIGFEANDNLYNLRDTVYNNQWYHLAISCNGSNFYYFVNGHRVGYPRVSGTRNDITTLRFRFAGNAGGIRIAQFALRNYAVWTSDFTPPTLLYKQI